MGTVKNDPDARGLQYSVDRDWFKRRAAKEQRYGSDQSVIDYYQNIYNSSKDGDNFTIDNSDGRWLLQSDTSAYKAEMDALAMQKQSLQANIDYQNRALALQAEQMKMQEEQAKLANVESGKEANDYIVSNAADVARRQQLRRGLMSTFADRNNQNAAATGAATKTDKLGG